jgi:hypothetical protein
MRERERERKSHKIDERRNMKTFFAVISSIIDLKRRGGKKTKINIRNNLIIFISFKSFFVE